MDIYIPKEQMPKRCMECWIDKSKCDYSWVGNGCIKPIDQWRLESCETCYRRIENNCHTARYIKYGLESFVCENWQGKVK